MKILEALFGDKSNALMYYLFIYFMTKILLQRFIIVSDSSEIAPFLPICNTRLLGDEAQKMTHVLVTETDNFTVLIKTECVS